MGYAAWLWLFLSFLLSESAYGAGCRFDWEISHDGVAVGESVDYVARVGDTAFVESSFSSSPFLEMLGVKGLIREFYGNAKLGLAFRSEGKLGEAASSIWYLNGTYEKDGQKPVGTESSSGGMIVMDSTSFPYLAVLGMIDGSMGTYAALVLPKGSPYAAKVILEKSNGGEFILRFVASGKSGIVRLDDGLNPKSFEFDDKDGRSMGDLKSMSCDQVK